MWEGLIPGSSPPSSLPDDQTVHQALCCIGNLIDRPIERGSVVVCWFRESRHFSDILVRGLDHRIVILYRSSVPEPVN